MHHIGLENLLFFLETNQWLTSLLMKKDYQQFVDSDILDKMNTVPNVKGSMDQITASISFVQVS